MTAATTQVQGADSTMGEMEPVRICADYDEDCPDVRCKVSCWLYDPQRGMCPYLRAAAMKEETK